MIFDDFQSAYKNTYVVKKCFWWIIAVVGHLIVSVLYYYYCKHLQFYYISDVYNIFLSGCNVYSSFMGGRKQK